MEWVYVYFHKPTGHLIDEDGNAVIFGSDGKTPAVFLSHEDAERYLVENDIRTSIAA